MPVLHYKDPGTGTFIPISGGTAAGTYVKIIGDTMTGDLIIDTAASQINLISGVGTRPRVTFGATGTAAERRLSLGGTGELFIGDVNSTYKPLFIAYPTDTNHAARKDYVDQSSGALNSVVSNMWTGAFTYCNFTTLAYAAGAARIFRMKTTQSFKTVQIEVTALGASGKCRIGVYSDTATGPGTLQSQTADIATSATGVVQSAITIPAGIWWLMLQNTGSSSFTLRSVLGDNPYSSGLLAPGTNSTQSALSQGGLGTTLANGWTTSGQSNGAAPIMYLQAS